MAAGMEINSYKPTSRYLSARCATGLLRESPAKRMVATPWISGSSDREMDFLRRETDCHQSLLSAVDIFLSTTRPEHTPALLGKPFLKSHSLVVGE
jgi:hypothetical protein